MGVGLMSLVVQAGDDGAACSAIAGTWGNGPVHHLPGKRRAVRPAVAGFLQQVADSAHRLDNALPVSERQPPNIRSVPAYAAVEHAEAAEPGMRDCYLVRGRTPVLCRE